MGAGPCAGAAGLLPSPLGGEGRNARSNTSNNQSPRAATRGLPTDHTRSTLRAARPARNRSVPPARLAHETDHARTARGRVGPPHLLRLLVARTADDLALHDLTHRFAAPMAERVHHEAILI